MTERNHLSHLSMQLEQIQNTEETKWAQRARIKWLKERDNNTKLFQHTANRGENKNHISLLEINGEELSNQNAIIDVFSNFFRELMGTTTPYRDIEVNWEQYYPI